MIAFGLICSWMWIGTAGTTRSSPSCSSLPFQTSCGSSDGSRGYRSACGPVASASARGPSSAVGMFTRLSPVWRTASMAVGAAGFDTLRANAYLPLHGCERSDMGPDQVRGVPRVGDFQERPAPRLPWLFTAGIQ